MTKSIFASKTFWVNALTILIVVATYFGITPDQGFADKTSGILLALSPIFNILLRFATNKGVTI